MNSRYEWVLYHKLCGCLWYIYSSYMPRTVKCPRCEVEDRVSFQRHWNGDSKSLRKLTVANRRSKMGQMLIQRFSGIRFTATMLHELCVKKVKLTETMEK